MKKLQEEVEKVLIEGALYFHCVKCNTIYNDSKWEKPLINFTELGYIRLPIEFEKMSYYITSGLCNRCFDKRKNEK